MPALLAIALPSLIKLAEGLFSKSDGPGAVATAGPAKQAFVMKAVEFIYDQVGSKVVHDFPGVDEKRLFLRTAEVWIEELVPAITK